MYEEYGEEHVVDAITEGGHGFVFDVVHPFGRTTTERRVSQRVHRVRWLLEFHPDKVTPAQAQALAMVYGCIMPPNECAGRLGIRRQSFLERLEVGEAKVDLEYAKEKLGRIRVKRGRPNAVLRAPDGAAEMVSAARERLGAGASYIVP